MIGRIALWLCLSVFAARAAADVPLPSRVFVEVRGDIAVAADGRVSGYTLDGRATLPPEVVALIDRSVPGWVFEPVRKDGVAVAAKAGMGLLVVARDVGGGRYEAAIHSANFFDRDSGAPRPVAIEPPRYPKDAARAGVGGTVYVALKIGDDGRVERAFAEQVNLDRGNDGDQSRMRGLLAETVVRAARRWTFTPPAAGADDEARTVRNVIGFAVGDALSHGPWQPYFPGPRSPVPWLPAPAKAGDLGGLAPDQPVAIRPALVLKTPLAAS